jgi:prepilin-type N-terminal cleavage/methylation domain-containing protein
MSPAHRLKSAFTLIELLIVVAIIAILAAIAVPNFLEAQVRAKVSRARADMRSAATALEAYYVDNNRYPLMRMVAPGFPLIVPDRAIMPAGTARSFNQATLPFQLTTPISYLTSLFDDPFKNINAKRVLTNGQILPATDVNDPTTRHYRYDNIFQLTTIPGFGFDNADLAEYGQWRLTSIGPDGEFYGSIGRRVYDPTNGTLSLGDIIRTQASSAGISRETTSGSN